MNQELKALQQISLELNECWQSNNKMKSKNQNIAKMIVVPLIAAVTSGGFLLYGTPLIHCPDYQV